MNSLDGKISLVTGGSRGIGRAIVLKLAEAGSKVAFNYWSSPEKAEDLAAEVEALGGECFYGQVDVVDESQAQRFCKDISERWGAVDILVNNAGITRDKSLLMMTSDDWRQVMACDLDGVFHVTKAVIFAMLKRQAGSIINISSISALTGRAGQTNYSAAKAGIIGFTRALAKEGAAKGVRVNAVAPGFIETDMIAGMKEKTKEKELALIPMGRFGSPAEVADLVLFLAGDTASYITGQVFVVDGGASL